MTEVPPVFFTRSQSREIDRRSSEEYHIPGIVLMENASRAVAEAAREELRLATGTAPRTASGRTSGRILVLCGGGNNGGDGLAAARHLANQSDPDLPLAVSIGLTTDPAKYKGDALTNWKIVQAMRLHTFDATPEALRGYPAEIVIDAIFGTGLAEAPRDPFPALVEAIGRLGAPVLAVDVPSGLDCDTGLPPGACVVATRTVTFVAEKIGFRNPASKRYTGRVTVGDIGCPRELIAAVSTPTP